MAYIEAIDPRGRTITCSKRNWQRHIKKRHAWAKDGEQVLVAVLANPTHGIYQDAKRPDRQCYYADVIGKEFLLKVVVAFDTENEGEVVTAYRRDKVNEEVCLWKPPEGL